MDSWNTFWQNVWDGMAGGYVGGQLSTEQGLAADRARAVGFDTSTGTFVAPQLQTSFEQSNPGVDPTTFFSNQRAQVTSEYLSGLDSSFQQLGGYSFFPASPVVGGDAQAIKDTIAGVVGAPSFSFSSLVPVVMVVVIVFLLIEAVK